MHLPLRVRRGLYRYTCAYMFNSVLYVAIHSRSGYPLAWGSAPWRECGFPSREHWYREAYYMALAKRAEASSHAGSASLVSETEFVTHFPTVWEYLTETTYTDGQKRQTSSLNIFFQDGVFKCSLRDRDVGEILWASADGPLGCLKVLEGKLVSGEADWRKDTYAGGAKKKPGKKTPGQMGG